MAARDVLTRATAAVTSSGSATTQPIPSAPPPLVPQTLREADLHAPTPEHLEACRERLAALTAQTALLLGAIRLL